MCADSDIKNLNFFFEKMKSVFQATPWSMYRLPCFVPRYDLTVTNSLRSIETSKPHIRRITFPVFKLGFT